MFNCFLLFKVKNLIERMLMFSLKNVVILRTMMDSSLTNVSYRATSSLFVFILTLSFFSFFETNLCRAPSRNVWRLVNFTVQNWSFLLSFLKIKIFWLSFWRVEINFSPIKRKQKSADFVHFCFPLFASTNSSIMASTIFCFNTIFYSD